MTGDVGKDASHHRALRVSQNPLISVSIKLKSSIDSFEIPMKKFNILQEQRHRSNILNHHYAFLLLLLLLSQSKNKNWKIISDSLKN